MGKDDITTIQGQSRLSGRDLDSLPDQINEKELWLTRYSIEHASDPIFWVKPNGRFIYVNQAACQRLGYTKEEMLEFSVKDIDPDYTPDQLTEMTNAMARSGSTIIRSHHRTKAGRVFPVEITSNHVTYNGENFIFCFVRDVTEKELAEERLNAERQKFEILIENAPFGMAMFDKAGKYLYVNPKFVNLFGYTLEEIPDRSKWFEKAYPDQKLREQVIKMWDEANAAAGIGERMRKVFPVTCMDKSLKYIDIITVKQENGDYIATYEDITQRHAAEDALAAETERLTVTLHSIGDGVIATDRAGKVVLVNTVAEELTGWKQSEAKGKDLKDILYIIDEKTRQVTENPVAQVLETGGVVILADHTILISRQGDERLISDSGAPIRNKNGEITGVVIVFRDVTEKKKMDEELQKMSKLESVGLLAGGIAHDFNNILAAILGNLSLARLGVPSGNERLLKRLVDAEQAVIRARDLTYQLLTFSRGGSPIKKTMKIQKILKETAQFSLTGSGIKCEFSFEDNLFDVDIDQGQIGQVVSNLVINSQQAMPDGGIIKIEARNVSLEHDSVKNGLFLGPGDYVGISVSDDGIGILPEDTGKVFDPYFTTKPGGSGLGLATSYSIIKNHGGCISVKSKPGQGTTFYIYLPASRKNYTLDHKIIPERKYIASKARILHMDDEEMILQTTRDMLESLGYEVETARDGHEAIKKYIKARDEGTPFDITILDITVPGGMGGKETIQRLLEIDPAIRAIVSSGYSNDPVMGMFGDYGFMGVIAKPYRLSDLEDVILKARRA